jgi:aryl-alcohol dehydrogenase-like predicted oxidoreductase
MSDAVSVVIPGARNPDQAVSNARAAELPGLTEEQMEATGSIYERLIRPHVHQRW